MGDIDNILSITFLTCFHLLKLVDMYITKSKYYQYQDRFWKINSSPSGCYTPMLKSMCEQLFNMHSYHARLLVCRFDLHQKLYTPDNKRITKFIRRAIRQLSSKYKVKHIGYSWVREQKVAEAQHYHFVLFIDGKKVNYPIKLNAILESIWGDMSGSFRRPDNCFYLCHRNDQETINDVIYRISYFAKAVDKDKKPPQTKNYNSSRIKPNSEALNLRDQH